MPRTELAVSPTPLWNLPPGPDSAPDTEVLRLCARYFRARADLAEAEDALTAAGLELHEPADGRSLSELRTVAHELAVTAGAHGVEVVLTDRGMEIVS
jgi:hypothetical protein